MRRQSSAKTISAHYEGAGHGRRMSGWTAPSSGPVQSVEPALRTLRNRVRDAVRNEPLAAAIVRVWVNGLIGSGIVARTPGEAPKTRQKIDQAWNAWMPKAEAGGVFDFYGLQVLAVRGLIESGECFLRIRYRKLGPGLKVPVQIEVIESDLLPQYDRMLENGSRIIQGIEFDADGQRVAYHFYRHHPGDKQGGDMTNLLRIPADQVSHVFMPTRPGQVRGVSPLAPVLTKLRALGNFDDAVLHRQEISNLFAGFVETPAASFVAGAIDPLTGAPQTVNSLTGKPPEETDASGIPFVGLEPGTMHELLPGESVKFSEPPDAGTNYADFMRVQYQAIAAGTGIPYELMSGDLRDVSDRTLRVSMNEWLRLIESVQWTVVIPKVCQFVRNAWSDAALLGGVLSAKEVAIANRAEWTPPRQRYIHPVQDVESMRKEVEAGFRSRSSVIAELGRDIADVDAERAAEMQRAQKLGLMAAPAPTPAEVAATAVDNKLLSMLG